MWNIANRKIAQRPNLLLSYGLSTSISSARLCTYITPFDEGLFGQAKNLSTGSLRDRPAFQDMFE